MTHPDPPEGATSGGLSSKGVPPKNIQGDTIAAVFLGASGAASERASLIKLEEDSLATTSRGEFERRVGEAALGLLALGISHGERVAILLDNCPEWIITDLACAAVGAVAVPVFTTLGTDEIDFIIGDSEPVAIVSSPQLLKKVSLCKGHLRYVVSIGAVPDGLGPSCRSLTMDRLYALGRESGDESLLMDRIKGISSGDPFSVIYTSGTTGRSKGVVLTHANLLSNIDACLKVLSISGKDRYLSFLPMSHIFERMIHHLMVYRGATIIYSRGFAYVGADMAKARPTIMAGVPFFFDRLKGRVMDGVAKAGLARKLVFNLSVKKAGKTTGSGLGGGPGLLDKAVFKKIREKVAGDLRFFISGGAALSKETADFFWALGMPVLEGYGLTETSPVVSVNTPGAAKTGTVGRVLPGVEVDFTANGEILVKGPNVMKGYFNMPEATRETVIDGWLHTGDVGRFDEDGFLVITDRAKDLIITSVGKNISPQRIETILRADELIKEALVYGNGRAHLVALIVADTEKLTEKSIRTGGLGWPIFEGEAHKAVAKRIKKRLKGLARFEQIKSFALIEDALTMESGDVTPTLKVRRERVGEKNSDVLEKLYER